MLHRTAKQADTVQYFVTNPASWDRETHCFSRLSEAFDFWREQPDRSNWRAVEVYAAEGRCSPLEDDWAEILEDIEADERAQLRHNRSLAIPSM